MPLRFKSKQSHKVRGAVLESLALQLTCFLSLFFSIFLLLDAGILETEGNDHISAI